MRIIVSFPHRRFVFSSSDEREDQCGDSSRPGAVQHEADHQDGGDDEPDRARYTDQTIIHFAVETISEVFCGCLQEAECLS
jgi:hypothetical protein